MKQNINKQKSYIFKWGWLFVICIAMVAPSCKKEWLDIKTDKRYAVPATVKDFQAILDQFSSFNQEVTISEVAADGHYYTENSYSAMVTSYPYYYQNVYTWNEIHPYETTLYYPILYSSRYNNILNSNVVLTESAKSNDPDKAGLDQVRAQALFHRGRSLFYLAQDFAPPYNVLTSKTDLGLALRLSTDVTELSRRSTLQETYGQIISDLLAANDILPNTPQFLTRASKPAVLGLLAKVYLVMGDYENAFKYANEYLGIKNGLLDYSTLSGADNYIGVNREVAFLTILSPYYTQWTTDYLIDQDLYDSYNNDDLRKQMFFRPVADGIAFKGHYSNNEFEVFSGIATDEIYLIRAECYARSGDLAAAMKDLNDLLRTRWAKNINGTTKYVDQVASDETDALNRIFAERKKQLILRNVRWSDLRRLNTDDRFKVTLTRTIGGNTYTLEPDSYRYTFPIPYEEIQKTGMPQNIGW